jgi:hypothetical protein
MLWAKHDARHCEDWEDSGAGMKPLNVWPMLLMLVAIIFIILWLNGAFA